MQDSEQKPERALLAKATLKGQHDAEDPLAEIRALAETSGVEICVGNKCFGL